MIADRDILHNARIRVDIEPHGFIEIVDVMPRLIPEERTGDYAIVEAARVSTAKGLKSVNEDRDLVRYMLRNHHGTPFEAAVVKVRVKLPIFVVRQWHRHRTQSYSEVSARYTELPDDFWTPANWRGQSANNKQGGEELLEYMPGRFTPQGFALDVKVEVEDAAFLEYKSRLQAGVSREMARSCLPVSTYTEMQVTANLRNWLLFLSLRMDGHAQKEIRDYAVAVHDLIRPLFPVTLEAWHDYEFESLRLSRMEVKALRGAIQNCRQHTGVVFYANPPISTNKREQTEWESKRALLGMSGPLDPITNERPDPNTTDNTSPTDSNGGTSPSTI